MKNLILLGVALFLSNCLFAQESDQTPAIPQASKIAITNLSNQIKNFPQEKVYLQLDKPYYSAGERLWFRIQMVHAAMLYPLAFSRYVYVELLNAHNEVLLRKKIRPSAEMLYFGQIDLSPDIAQGWYSIRAYTNYMRNIDESYFYRQKIYIGNSLKGLNGVNIDESTTGNHADIGGKVEVKAPFDVQFFPEGGHLIAGSMQSVGFKAIATNGLGTEVNGKILDIKNEEVCTFKSSHLGMGLFLMTPTAGMAYTAVCENSHGQRLTFKLPEVSDQHYALRVRQTPDIINVSVLTPNEAPRKDTLYLIGDLRGIPIFQATLLPDNMKGFTFSKQGLKSGVTQLLLINGKNEVLSERLVYIFGKDKANLNVTLDKQNYAKRDAVHASLLLKDSQGEPVKGDFSISVTDDNDVRIDTNETTIESYLLLQSDLRGHIENPNEYFRAGNKSAMTQMDLLMLTQGWKRYDVAATVAGKDTNKITFGVENGPVISGKVQSFPVRKGLPRTNVSIFIHQKMNFDAVTTDNHGLFSYQCPEFPDSTSIMIQANKKEGSLVELVVFPDSFPKINLSCVFPDNLKQDAIMKSFLAKSRDKYNYENGKMSVTLKDVVITAKKVDKNKKIREDRGAMYNTPDYSFDDEKELSRATSILTLLQRAPGVTLDQGGTGVLIRNQTPLIMVDNMEYSMESLQTINPSDVKLIDIVKDVAEVSMYGPKGSNGVICIYMKRGNEKTQEPVELGRHQKEILPLGYSLPAQFYVPKYQAEVNKRDPTPDLRSTIYWNPMIKSDANGAADLFFFTADSPGTYTITAEGVTPKGEIIHYQGKLNRK